MFQLVLMITKFIPILPFYNRSNSKSNLPNNNFQTTIFQFLLTITKFISILPFHNRSNSKSNLSNNNFQIRLYSSNPLINPRNLFFQLSKLFNIHKMLRFQIKTIFQLLLMITKFIPILPFHNRSNSKSNLLNNNFQTTITTVSSNVLMVTKFIFPALTIIQYSQNVEIKLTK